MNGIHDMGGMQDFGAIRPEPNEPVFHERWESRLFALRRALGAFGKWNIHTTRYDIELLDPVEYLRLGYYERQFVAFLPRVVKSGLVSQREIETGVPAPGQAKETPALTVEKAQKLIAKGIPDSRDVAADPRFRAGQRVQTRNINPLGHTRLPRYARGRFGTVDRDHGVFVFPDTDAEFHGEKPQHLYSVRFAARELWGDQAAPRDSVYIDLWDDYLEPA